MMKIYHKRQSCNTINPVADAREGALEYQVHMPNFLSFNLRAELVQPQNATY
jgi:hypothetical protein